MSDIFVIPSIAEVVQITLLEAFHYGLPVISTPVGHNNDLIKDGINGFLIPKKDPESISNKILELNKNPELINKFSRGGLKTAQNHLWKNCINQWIRVFKESCNNY